MAGFVGEIKGELLADIMRAVGGMMHTKLAGIGDRLLPQPTIRPPLAASRVVDVGHIGAVEATAARRGTYEMGNVVMEGVSESWSTVTGKKGRGKGKKSKAVSASKSCFGTSGVASSATAPVVVAPPAPLKLPVGGLSQTQPGLQQQGLGGAKYGQADRSTAAVVLTLRKDAAKRGHTYAALLSRAKQDISLSGLGIERGVSRVDVTLATSNIAWRLSGWEVMRDLETFSD
ncbi:unnamed protein product [Pieris brassicae]|uniref:Uncharacterized protein n=1 Tax=Pieris brassicae TaxID=7116 RepID=A0A9P0XDG3_PIEBR|nr:unnamed protein product [Pieris brassicae]